MDNILNDRYHYFHRWTKAAALHSAIFYQGKEKIKWLGKGEEENDILLKETAERILQETNTSAAL
jgi:hypothetical protein